MNYFTITIAILGIFITSFSTTADAQSLSEKPVYPSTFDGKYMVYNSGAITSYETRTFWIISQTNEYYIYSPKGVSGVSGRITYDGYGNLKMEDKIIGDMYRELVGKNRIYKRCGAIFSPGVKYKVTPIRDPKTQKYYTDRWNVSQSTYACDMINVRHHSSDDTCETFCVRWHKKKSDYLDHMKLYSYKNHALEDSKKRPY